MNSKAEGIIKKIQEADEIEIMEFDFDPCFEYLRKMEAALREIAECDDIHTKLTQLRLCCKFQNIAMEALDDE